LKLDPHEVDGERGWELDRDAQVELWTRAGDIKAKLTKGADIRRIDSLPAWAVLITTDPGGAYPTPVRRCPQRDPM
jgi:hypothetical protein